jgi:hypothetical protein
MRRTAMAASLLAGFFLVAGCSDPKPEGTGVKGLQAVPVGSKPIGAGTPLSGMSALAVWEKTKADADATKSVHVAARFLDGERFNLKMTDTGKVFGLLTLRGDRILVRRLGPTMYVKAARRFWTRNGHAAAAKTLAGKWVRVRQGSAPDLEQLFELTDMDYVIADVMSLSATEQQGLKLVPGITIGRRQTVGLTDPTATDESGGSQTLYVSATDPALPMNFAMAADKSQYMLFRSWNEDFTVVAPKGAIALRRAR